MTLYTNARGEMVMSHHVFAELDLNAVMKSLLPAKPHRSRRQRRLANGSLHAS